jgi:acyl-coenzyme A thioesterase PaaI-like protein
LQQVKEGRVKSRFLREGEKRDVVVAVMEVLKQQNPGCTVRVEVGDWTDDRGVPQYTATISTVKNEAPPG